MIKQIEIREKIDECLRKKYIKIRRNRNRTNNAILYINKELNIPLQVISDFCQISIGSCSNYINKYYSVNENIEFRLKDLIDYGTSKIENDINTNNDLTENEKKELERIIDYGHSILYGKAIRSRNAKTKSFYRSST